MASTDYLLQALHITDPNPLAEQIAGDPNAGALWTQLNQWIGNLPTATRTQVMSAISTVTGTGWLDAADESASVATPATRQTARSMDCM